MQAQLYEHPAWLEVPEQVMRPGGLTVTEQALAYCSLPPGAQVLDLGCGAGATLRHLAAKHAVSGFGVDISDALLDRAQESGNGSLFVQARSEQLPFATASMDAVISECTLSIFEVERALYEAVRVLKPGGFFIVSDLYARNQDGIAALRRLPPGTCIGAALTQHEIEDKLADCGLQLSIWQDCSERLKEFPLCTLSTAAEVDPFDLVIAASKAKLGYYFLIARKREERWTTTKI